MKWENKKRDRKELLPNSVIEKYKDRKGIKNREMQRGKC